MAVLVDIDQADPSRPSPLVVIVGAWTLCAGQAFGGRLFPVHSGAISQIDCQPAPVRGACDQVRTTVFIHIPNRDIFGPGKELPGFASVRMGRGRGQSFHNLFPVTLAIPEINVDARAVVRDDKIRTAIVV
jgi:hypothetical protein